MCVCVCMYVTKWLIHSFNNLQGSKRVCVYLSCEWLTHSFNNSHGSKGGCESECGVHVCVRNCSASGYCIVSTTCRAARVWFRSARGPAV